MKIYTYILLLFLIFPVSLKSQEWRALPQDSLKEGDVLFEHILCGPLCNAIDSVTTAIYGLKFNHCAMVVKTKKGVAVLEAIGPDVHQSPVTVFMNRGKDSTGRYPIIAGRLKPPYKHLIASATWFALNLQGQPYDDSFLMSNGKYYCSELIYEAYKAANQGREVFTLTPMTFCYPGTKNYVPAWLSYFNERHQVIPEGKPGINPGSISMSGKFDFFIPYQQP